MILNYFHVKPFVETFFSPGILTIVVVGVYKPQLIIPNKPSTKDV
jgi:hypothetical protein